VDRQLRVGLDEEDYPFWRWVTAHWYKWETLEQEQIDEVKEKFKKPT